MTAENPFLNIRVRGLLLWVILGNSLFVSVLNIVNVALPMGKSAMESITTVLYFLLVYYWIYSKTKEGNIDIRLFLQRASNTKWLHLIGLVPCLYLFSVGSTSLTAKLLVYVSSLLKLNIASNDAEQSVFSWVVFVLTAIVLGPIVEEILYRGILLSRWSSKWGMRKAALISAIAFALTHADILGAFLFAVCMTILYLRTQTLLIPIAAHALNNTIAVAIEFWGTHDASGRDTIFHFLSITWVCTLCLAATSPILVTYIYRHLPKKEALSPYILRMNERSASIEILPAG